MGTLTENLTKREYLQCAEATENPVLIRTERDAVSLFAFQKLNKLILELREKSELSDEELEELVKELARIYAKRKIENFMAERLDNVGERMSNLFRHFIDKDPEKINTSFYYSNAMRHSIKHEF